MVDADQLPPPPKPPTGSALGDALLEALGDPTTRRLLLELTQHEQDVHSLVVRTGLPQSSVYRHLKEMQARRLVRISRLAFTPEGRKVEIFRSNVRQARLYLEAGQLRVEVVPAEDSADRIVSMWSEVARRPG
ncbi:MAG: ArsR family transcriptional regulator [Thermoplasmata archaeon]